jgi:MarR-like DNA-binding transcriptional regulator SgrR of sgrS sRNA
MFNKDLTDVLTVVQNDMLVVLKESVGSGDSCSWHAGSGRGRRSSLANIARTGLAPLSRHCSVSSEITQDY